DGGAADDDFAPPRDGRERARPLHRLANEAEVVHRPFLHFRGRGLVGRLEGKDGHGPNFIWSCWRKQVLCFVKLWGGRCAIWRAEWGARAERARLQIELGAAASVASSSSPPGVVPSMTARKAAILGATSPARRGSSSAYRYGTRWRVARRETCFRRLVDARLRVRARQLANDSLRKSRNILRLSARDQPIVHVHRFVHPRSASISNVRLQRWPRRQRATRDRIGFDEQPRPMADHGDRLVREHHLSRELHRLLVAAQRIAVDHASGEKQRRVFGRRRLLDRAIDGNLIALVVMVESLN